jgi:pyrroloquinoline quinone biosynthesis protein D
VIPRLARHVTLRWQAARDEWLLVLPESVVVLNDTAAAVLYLCDGERRLDAIVAGLADDYDGVEETEVAQLLRELADQRLVELG